MQKKKVKMAIKKLQLDDINELSIAVFICKTEKEQELCNYAQDIGKECYKKTFYFSFDKEESLHEIFKVNKNALYNLSNCLAPKLYPANG